MPRGGRRSKVHLTLTPTERATLTGWLRKPTLPAVQVRRARLVLLVADGRLTLVRIASTIGLSRRHMYKWLARFQAEGCAGLLSKRQRKERAKNAP